MRFHGFVLVISLILLTVPRTEATCDDSICPIVCQGTPCPDLGDAAIDIDLDNPASCREVTITSPGYPNGYHGDKECEWSFDSMTVRASIVVTVQDFEGHDDDRLIMERTRGGNTAEFYNHNADDNPASPYSYERAEQLRIEWDPTGSGGSFSRGVRLQLLFGRFDAGTACTTGETISLDMARPSFGINSPRFNQAPAPATGECYYTITSPADTQIILEWPSFVIRPFDDFIYLYDLSSGGNELLRIMTRTKIRFSPTRTGTNNLRVVTQDNAGQKSRYFARVFFESISTEKCSGNGDTSGDMCTCPADFNSHDYCHVSNTQDFEPLSASEDAHLTAACTSGVAITYDMMYDTSTSSGIFASSNYFTGSDRPIICQWIFSGPEDSQILLRFQDLALDSRTPGTPVDTLYVNRLNVDHPRGIIRYSSPTGILPFSNGVTLPLEDEPVVINGSFRIIYEGNTDDFATFKGILFEVHLLGEGLCSEPCLNGGQCTSTCICDAGFTGQFCEHTLPPDYTCLVKNHYIKPHFAHPVKLYAIAGTNTFTTEAFNFEYVGPSKYYTEMIPTLPPPTDMDYGRLLALPAECDRKEKSTRFGAFSCNFGGDEFIDQVRIISIVNTISELIAPVGRFTKTVSVGDTDVTLSVTLLSGEEQSLRWRFDGQVQKKWNGMSTITIAEIKSEDCGFYEAFVKGGEEDDVVIYRLIVRDCPDGMFGSDCEPCANCQNGGTCHDVYGTCVCPPAYGGADCSELLSGNAVSRNTGLSCPGHGIASPGCRNVMLCLPDPGGCMCMPGWTGSKCDQACTPLKFGLECSFDCHCDSGDRCDAATGACPNGCAAPFLGTNCQQTP